MTDPSQFMRDLFAMWVETDRQARRPAMEEHFHPDARLHDPDGEFVGVEALEGFSDSLQDRFPGARFTLVGEPQVLGDALRAMWTFGPSGEHRDRPVQTAAGHRPSRPRGSNRARRPRLDAGRPAGVWLIVGAPGGGRVITAGVRVALCRVSPGAMCCRWAELATLVQMAGHLRTTAVPGEPVVLVVELGSAAAAERCCRLAAEADPAAQVMLAVPDTPTTAPVQAITTAPPSATPPPDPAAWAAARREAGTRSGWTVLVRPGAALVRHAGLIDNRGGLLVGLPPRVLRGGTCCAAAAWRAALLTLPPHPTPRAAGRRGGRVRVAVACPNTVIAVALVGLARRLDIAAGWIPTTAWTTPRSTTPPGSARCCGRPSRHTAPHAAVIAHTST